MARWWAMPRGAPDAGAGQSPSRACGVLGAGCLVTDFGCVKSLQRQPVPRPPVLQGGPFLHTGAQASACTLSLHPHLLPCSEIVLLTPTCGDQGVLGLHEPPATPGLVGLSLHCADLCGHSATWGEPRVPSTHAHTVTAILAASVAIWKSSDAFPVVLEQLQLLLLGEGKEHLFSLSDF